MYSKTKPPILTMNQPHLWFISNKYKTHNFPNNKQFNTTSEGDQRKGQKRLG